MLWKFLKLQDLKNYFNYKEKIMFNLTEVTKNLKTTVEITYIADIMVVHSKTKEKIIIPEGYEIIDVDLNEGAGGDYIYFCIKRDTTKENGIDDIKFLCGNTSNLSCPVGYEKVNVDLNKGAGGKYIYLCKHRGSKNPLIDIKVIRSNTKDAAIPEGYYKIPQDLNEGTKGKYIYLCYLRML